MQNRLADKWEPDSMHEEPALSGKDFARGVALGLARTHGEIFGKNLSVVQPPHTAGFTISNGRHKLPAELLAFTEAHSIVWGYAEENGEREIILRVMTEDEYARAAGGLPKTPDEPAEMPLPPPVNERTIKSSVISAMIAMTALAAMGIVMLNDASWKQMRRPPAPARTGDAPRTADQSAEPPLAWIPPGVIAGGLTHQECMTLCRERGVQFGQGGVVFTRSKAFRRFAFLPENLRSGCIFLKNESLIVSLTVADWQGTLRDYRYAVDANGEATECD